MTETEMTGRPSTRLEPSTTWTVVTDSPLKGLSLAREAGTILAWDEGNQLYLLNVQGESLSYSRVPNRIQAGAISDEGSLIALLVEPEDAGLLLLSADFDVQVERPAPSEATFVTIDPHGRYLAVGTRHNALHLINRYGRPAGRLETMEPLSHLCFVPGRPLAIGAAAFGMLVGVALEPSRSQGRLEPEIIWQDRLMSNVGRLALNGDGGMILASCYTLGIQRFDLRGRNEGSYHLGGTVSHAVPDFPGRTIAAATLEGELAVMNSAGNVRWRTRLPRPVDRAGDRPAGPLRDLRPCHRRDRPPRPVRRQTGPSAGQHVCAGRRRRPDSGPRRRAAAGSVRAPDWLVPAVETDQQAETAVIAVVRRPADDRALHQPAPAPVVQRDGPEAGTRARHDRRRPDPPDRPRLARRRDRPPDPALRPETQHASAGSTSAWSSSPTWPSSPTTSAWPWSRSAIGSAG